jgi:hypothetical protein
MRLGRECGLAAVIVEQPAHFSVEFLVMNEDPRDVIGDGWGSLPACAVDRRVMDFGRWPEPDKPQPQVFEDGPDDGRNGILDAADDPHGAPASRADQRIDLVYLLNQARPVPPEGLFISLHVEDAGDGIVVFRLLPFPRETLL